MKNNTSISTGLSELATAKLRRLPEESEHGGNFVSGFTIGALAGVLGYFLFGTKRGREKVEEIQEKWMEKKPEVLQQIQGVKVKDLFNEVSKIVQMLKKSR